MKTGMRASLFFVALLAFSCTAEAGETLFPGGELSELPGTGRSRESESTPEDETTGLPRPSTPGCDGVTLAPAGVRFKLQAVVFEGNTVFSERELKAVADDFVGKEVSLADLEELRYRLTRKYTDNGYVNSGVILKQEQVLDDGTVSYQVREGRLDEVRVKGVGRLRPEYVGKRIWPDAKKPLNMDLLQKRFQLLLRDPLIRRLNGRLLPGTDPGSAVLDLDVERARPYELRLGVDNHLPPSTGAERAFVDGVLRNLSGYGDFLNLGIGFNNIGDGGFAGDGIDEFYASYSLPVDDRDSMVVLRFDENDTAVVEQPLKDLDIESETLNIEFGFLPCIYRSLSRTAMLGFMLAWRENQTSLLGSPFPFSLGAEDDGDTRVTVLRLSQEMVERTAEHALAFRSTFSFGIDAFNATVHGGDRPDGKFFAWLGQAQYARRLGNQGLRLILRGDIQLAADPLLDMERFAVGGVRTVRGYRENELVRDNGYAVSAELRYPLWQEGDNYLQIAAFMDYGSAWNKGESAQEDHLHSVGLGFLWNPFRRVNAELYLAKDLEKAEDGEEHDLQDDGIHFRLIVSL